MKVVYGTCSFYYMDEIFEHFSINFFYWKKLSNWQKSSFHVCWLLLVSKKQVNKLLKNVRRLYSSFSGEVVDVLLELLLKAMDLSNMVELCENQETSHRSETTPTVFNAWKPVVIKLFKKEPELLWSLLKAVLIKIETKGGNNNEIGR